MVKQIGHQENIAEVKKYLRNKVNPAEMGVGVSMGRATKKGSLIINCISEKSVIDIQSEMQNKLDEEYSVERPKTLNHRLKVIGVNES